VPKIERRVADDDEDEDGDEAEADDEAEPLSASWSSLPSVRVPREIVRATGMNERLPDVEVGRGGTAARKGYIFPPDTTPPRPGAPCLRRADTDTSTPMGAELQDTAQQADAWCARRRVARQCPQGKVFWSLGAA